MAKPPVKAEQIAEQIADRIQSGELKPGEWLGSERQLAERHEVGRNTVRSALRLLAEAGLIEQTGAGARVIARVPTWVSESAGFPARDSEEVQPSQETRVALPGGSAVRREAHSPMPDAAEATYRELVGIRAELREITQRLAAIEERLGEAPVS